MSGPAPRPTARSAREAEREDEAVNALQRIAKAAGLPEAPLVLAFEDKAVEIFDGCLERLHGETLRAQGLMAGWLGKGRGTVARLAAVLALLDWTANRPNNAPPPTVIRQQHLLDAWALWDRYYRPHAQAVFDRAGPSDRDRQLRLHARRVVGWIRTHDATEVSREDVRREALSQRVKAAGADEVIEALEEAGVLREVDEATTTRPRPPGAALAGQSGAAGQTRCANCGKAGGGGTGPAGAWPTHPTLPLLCRWIGRNHQVSWRTAGLQARSCHRIDKQERTWKSAVRKTMMRELRKRPTSPEDRKPQAVAHDPIALV